MARHSHRSIALFAVAILLVVVAGCKSTTGGAGGRGPTYSFVDPAFVAPEGATRIPIIGFVNTTLEAEAVNYFYPHLEEALRAKPSYVVVSTWSVERQARRNKVEEQLEALRQRWRDERSLDPPTHPNALREFGEAFGAEYVMGGELSEWSSTRVEHSVEGYSHSDVEARLKIFEVATGKLVWEAHDLQQVRSAHYDPAASSDRVQAGIVRGEAQLVPEPPPIDEVAQRVAVDLVSTLP